MKKRFLFRILSALLVIVMLVCESYCFASAEQEVSVSASSAILIEAEGLNVLYEKNSEKRMPMASITKIMTALVALETGDTDSVVCIPKAAVGTEGSSIYLKLGEELSLIDLLYALMLESANDSAVAIAVSVAGSVDSFVEMMNDKAEELGLENTHFTNPHGLSDDEHYTSAYDFAVLTAYALKNKKFSEIVSTKRYCSHNRVFINHNKLLRIYEGCIGVKTGFTKASGRCLVSAAERDGLRLVAVTLNAPDDWNDHMKMLDYGFSRYESLLMCESGELTFEVPVVGGTKASVKLCNRERVAITVEKGSHIIDAKYNIKRFYYAGNKAGDVGGTVVFTCDGKKVKTVELYFCEDTEVKKQKNFFDFLLDLFK